jgi:phosphoglycerate dehydrogenase-like enzyme
LIRGGHGSRQENASQQQYEQHMSDYKTIGFIGLGVMGEPICRNLVKKSGVSVLAFDLAPEPLARLRADGADVAPSVADVVNTSDIVFLCLPSAKHVHAVFNNDGILKNVRNGQVVVDLGTSSVSQTRDFAKQLQAGARPGRMRRSRARVRPPRMARSASWSARRAKYTRRSSR